MGRFEIDRKPVLFLLPFALALAAFFPVLFYDLVWDDAIIYATQLPAFGSPLSAFGPPPAISSMTQAYYRPLVFVSYMFDRSVASFLGDDLAMSNTPHWVPHATTLLGHAVAAGLVALLARKLLCRRADAAWLALLAGCLFAIHPSHADSVAFASGRSDVFATVFFLAALLAALATEGAFAWSVAATCFFVSLLFKEVGAVLLILCPLALMLTRKKRFKDVLPTTGALVVAFAVYLALRFNASTWSNQLSLLEDPVGKLTAALGYYVYRTAVPWPQYLFVMELPFGPPVGGAILAVAACAAWLYWKKSEDRGLSAFLLVFFPLALAPSLLTTLVAFSVAPAADRYLYLPGVAASILLALFPGSLKGKIRAFAAVALGMAFLATDYAYSPLRKNDDNFWSGIASQPVSSMYAMPWVSLGQINLRAGRYEEARAAFKKATGPEMRSNLIQARLAVHGYAEANTGLAERLAATAPGTAMELARTAANILQNQPLRRIDDARAAKGYAEALMALLAAEERSGLSDPALRALAVGAAREALAINPGNAALAARLAGLASGAR